MTMNLKILLPFRVFLEIRDVSRIVFETPEGFYGLLPKRLDCVAAVVPGIFTYETPTGVNYLAIDEGVLVKAGPEVLVSVRNAIPGENLGKLRESVEKEYMGLDEKEKIARSTMAKLESGFIRILEKFRKASP
jgi:F-type H+-transporting ATPase subunit epsilon